MSNKLLSWNRQISNKFVNELVFVAFWILPVYEVSGLADILVLNSIEFWSGSNPMASGKRVIEGQDGKYLVECRNDGYDITNPDGTKTRLDFNADTREWSVLEKGRRVVFLTYVDDSHVQLPMPDGSTKIFALTQNDVYAYQTVAAQSMQTYACR